MLFRSALFGLLALHRAAGDARAEADTLARLAGTTSGGARGALLASRASALQAAGEPLETVVTAWREALDADPANTPAFMALERHHRQSMEWAALASLYRAEGDRLSSSDLPEAAQGAEAAWWYARAAREIGRAHV